MIDLLGKPLSKGPIAVILAIIIIGSIAGYLFYTNYVQGTVTLTITDPAQAQSSLRFNVTSVTVSFLGKPSVVYNVPSGTLKVPVINGGFQITAASSVTVQLTFSFNNSEILAMNGYLAPVATAKVA